MKSGTISAILLWAMLAQAACAPQGQASVQKRNLDVKLLYPTKDATIEMGRQVKAIIAVTDEAGQPVPNARLELTILDATGKAMTVLSAEFGSGGVYRSQAWTVPHRSPAGAWTLSVKASSDTATGSTSTPFGVKASVSEVLLEKYGFWVDAPRLTGTEPLLFKEQGNADNGAIIWGAQKPQQHIFAENWLEVQWRKGDFALATPEQARGFMLGKIGNTGMTPVRELGPFEKVKFKQWEAWQDQARGQLAQYDEQWMVFYAPEVDKTYAIGTTLVLPPPGIDPHAALRDGFEVHPEVQAQGIAPAELAVLLPGPELVSPSMDSRFMGSEAVITLRWKPEKDLAADEYFQVRIDYNYGEGNTALNYSTRDTEFRLPAGLYDQPNCGIFNWQVTLMRQTGVDADGQPRGEPISYNSLYWYAEWLRPPGEKSPFIPKCPNPQT